jgi:hypothetical protein
MLDAFIIEELKRRELEELARDDERPRLEIPVYYPITQNPEPEEKKSTVITIEM